MTDGRLAWEVELSAGKWDWFVDKPKQKDLHPKPPARKVVQKHFVGSGKNLLFAKLEWELDGDRIVGVRLIDSPSDDTDPQSTDG